MAASTNFKRTVIENQPEFDFMLSKDEFYINTPGVSVTEPSKSYTTYSEGIFYILNRNTSPIYFGDIQLTSIKFRDENGYPANAISFSFSSDRMVRQIVYSDYDVFFSGNKIGVFTIARNSKYLSKNKSVIYPFQSVEMSAMYRVFNIKNSKIQYFGKSNLNKDKKLGILDLELSITCYSDVNESITINDTMITTLKLVNTGYMPLVLIENIEFEQ
jgi:hypothetical protein